MEWRDFGDGCNYHARLEHGTHSMYLHEEILSTVNCSTLQ